MANRIFKCNVCGNMVEMLYEGGGELVCCGQPMEELKEKKEEEGNEKHLPVIEKTDSGIKVKVGSNPHPMEEKHYITMIEIIADGKIYRKNLKPGEAPEAEFPVKAENVTARELCNVHGLWSTQ